VSVTVTLVDAADGVAVAESPPPHPATKRDIAKARTNVPIRIPPRFIAFVSS
jgi:hypothetical protein